MDTEVERNDLGKTVNHMTETSIELEAEQPRRSFLAFATASAIIGLAVIGISDYFLAIRSGHWPDPMVIARDAGSALFVASVIAFVFELKIHRQATRAFRHTLYRVLKPLGREMVEQTKRLNVALTKAERTLELVPIMAVAKKVVLQEIFDSRPALYKELRQRFLDKDVTSISMIGVSLRDFFAGDAGMYAKLIELNNKMRMQQAGCKSIRAVIMRGNCAEALRRICEEEGEDFYKKQSRKTPKNWFEKSRLWADYKRVTDSWELHFDKVDLYEFDSLPTAWVVLIESNEPSRNAVYIEQYHYGRIGKQKEDCYSCLGGLVPVLKYGPGDVYNVLNNHVDAIIKLSAKSERTSSHTVGNGRNQVRKSVDTTTTGPRRTRHLPQ